MKLHRMALPGLLILCSCSGEPRFDASGNFEATEVVISAETAGKIIEFNVEVGDTIAPGQALALIDTMQLHLTRRELTFRQSASDAGRPDIALQLAAMRRELEHQQAERTRLSNLRADGAATAKQLDDIDAAIRVLQDRIAAQKSTLGNSAASINESASAIRAQIERINDQIADCRITSPLEGTVLTKYAEAGEYVAPGRPLLKIANLRKIYLRAYFTSAQLADLKLGQKVTVVANFGGDDLIEYPGEITWISSESEFTPKNIQTQDSRSNLVYAAKISVKNDGRLKIGGFGNVRL